MIPSQQTNNRYLTYSCWLAARHSQARLYPLNLDAHENGPRVCSFFGPTNLVRSGESPLGILALDTLQRGRRLAERGRVIVPL
jgi:hypothetical protein